MLYIYSFSMAQTLRNLVNKSRQRIAAVYSEVDRRLKSSDKKKARKWTNQEKDNQNTEHVVERMQKIRMSEGLSESGKEMYSDIIHDMQ